MKKRAIPAWRSAKARYTGLRVNRYGPRMTSEVAGRMSMGLERT